MSKAPGRGSVPPPPWNPSRRHCLLSLCATLACRPVSAQLSRYEDFYNEASALYRVGQFRAALQTARKAARANEIATDKAEAAQSMEAAKAMSLMALSHAALGEYAAAEALSAQAVAIQRKLYAARWRFDALGPTLRDAGDVAFSAGKLAEAEARYREVLTVEKRQSEAALEAMNHLSDVLTTTGKYAEAESLLLENLSAAAGKDSLPLAAALEGLAHLHQARSQHALVEPLLTRAMAIKRQLLSAEDVGVARSLGYLADHLAAVGRAEEARGAVLRALAMQEWHLGKEHPAVAGSLYTLGTLLMRERQFAQAEPLLRRSVAIRVKSLGNDHVETARSKAALAETLLALGKTPEATTLLRGAIDVLQAQLGAESCELGAATGRLAELLEVEGDRSAALAAQRTASRIFGRRLIEEGTTDAALELAGSNRQQFQRHLRLIAGPPGQTVDPAAVEESFRILQLSQASATANAIAKMAARFATEQGELAVLVERKQQHLAQLTRLEQELVRASSTPGSTDPSSVMKRIRESLEATHAQAREVDAQLDARFPAYQQLIRPQPLDLAAARQLLRPAEALLAYAIEPGQKGYLWVVSSRGSALFTLNVDAEALAADVAAIRSEMAFDADGKPKPVDLRKLFALYGQVFAPAERELQGVEHLLIAPAGPLQGLPLGMLVASAPGAPGASGAQRDHGRVDWLAKRYAMSVLPSVASLRALRLFAKPSAASQPFAGFGDPLLTDASPGAPRGRSLSPSINSAFGAAGEASGAADATGPNTRAIADVRMIRSAPRLPETADELNFMASAMKTGPESLWLGARATETNLKALDLKQYRVLVFATHGLVAGELGGASEPGLILTPPLTGTAEDDGFLTASEIAGLKLDANWVVLSACNTAAPSGAPGAQQLSGLARAFFYAGARSLLVSHWPVASKATTQLTTDMFAQFQARPALGKAAAQRAAMMRMMQTPGHPEYAHPLFWSPFTIVGEGGA